MDINEYSNYYIKYVKYKKKYLTKLNLLKFLEWYKNKGGISRLVIRDMKNDERETIASSNIELNDTILQIPRKLLITTKQFNQFNINDEISGNNKLTFLLMYNKKNNKYMEYINILPSNFKNLPTQWSEDQLRILKNTSVYDEILSSIERHNKDFRELHKHTSHIMPFTQEEYIWARNCVNTRNFSVFMGDTQVSCLTPFADMLNHSSSKNSDWYFDNSIDSFVVKANTNISKDTIVTESYGNINGFTYLLWYGFFPANLHSVNIDNNLSQHSIENITNKLQQLKRDYNFFKHLENQKEYETPILILKTEIDILDNII